MTAPVDPEEIARAAALLFPAGAIIELRALGPGGVHSGYFDDFAVLTDRAAAIATLNDLSGVYLTLNEVNPALLSRRANRVRMRVGRSDPTTADADILRRRWLPVDLDPVRPAGVSSSEAEHDAALARAEEIAGWLSGKGFAAPVVADSGNGAHLLYRIDLANDAGAAELVKGILTTLDALFSDEAVTVDTANFNAARIWKCYGTPARKGDDTTDRPHRTARLLSVPDDCEVVDASTLQQVASLLPKEAPKTSTRNGKKQATKIDLGVWLREHGIAVKSAKPWHGGTLFVLADCPFSAAHTDGAFAIQFANGAIFAGCHHASCGGGSQRWGELRERYEGKRKATGKKTSGTGAGNGVNDAKATETVSTTTTEPPAPPIEPEGEHRRQALALLESGDPLTFLLDTFNRDHVGDRTVAECLVMSIASQSVANTHGIHVSVSGNSGKGKSHACSTMLRLVPDAYRLAGTVSDKALYYNTGIRPGTVFLFDDIALSDDLQEILKSATAAFRERIEHQTLTADRQLKVCSIPERCVWWLAKVEDVGDDQVMNRVLTTWIDDSQEQDQRVLDHLRQCEAVEGEAPECCDDLLVCQAVWELLKGACVTVQIPFAERVKFSSLQNRRNPNMLFDLIKSHALLFRFQRERFTTTEGGEGIRATEEDFAAAARLYRELHTEAGGQETKLTKNEAAALKTMDALDQGEFTLRQLQRPLGVSYYHVRRVMNGYTSRGRTYSGLLEKCPALSLVDVTVSTDGIYGPIRRHEHVFTFDREAYRRWNGNVVVWLDPTPPDGDETGDDDGSPPPATTGDMYSSAASVQQSCSTCCNDESGDFLSNEEDLIENRETLLQEKSTLQQIGTTPSPECSHVSETLSVCDLRNAAHEIASGAIQSGEDEKSEENGPYQCSNCCNVLHNAVHAAQGDAQGEEFGAYGTSAWPAPAVADDPPGASYTCESERPSGIIPLPGILTPEEFARTGKDMGTCAVCGKGRVTWWSEEGKMGICEGCYSRLLREKNWGEGVV